MQTRNARALAGLTATVMTVGLVGVATTASGTVDPVEDPRTAPIYNSMQDPAPASHPSFGFTATSTREMGDLIEFGGIAREIESITVGMNSWACETGTGAGCVTTPGATFDEPITVHFYQVGAAGAVGAEITSITEDFEIPFRPSANAANCGDSRWYSEELETCQNGMTVPVTFDLTDTELTLPNQVIVSVTYPTSRFGEKASGPWDSLNLDTVATDPSVGTDVDSDVLYVDSDWASMYDGGATGTFRATTDYEGYALNIKIEAKPSTDIVAMGKVLGDFEKATSIINKVSAKPIGALMPAAGCWYGTAPVTNYTTHGTQGFVNTKYAGYANAFPAGGYTASADFYLDAKADAGQFTWSHAANNTNGTHLRDFVFIAGANGSGTWTVGAGNGVNQSGPSSYGADPLTITKSGWYTFEHTLYAGADNLLYVDLTVLDAKGVELASWTLGGEAADMVPGVVGGNRYGWLVTNTYAGLPVDNVVLGKDRPTAGCAPFTDVKPEAGPKFSSHAAAIGWMGATGLSKGWINGSGAEFRPAADTDRDAMAAFFYRAAGEPKVTLKKSPFVDISSNPASKYYNKHWKAIYWMAENGYANGWKTSKGTVFGPHAEIQRDAVAAFMYRMHGSPEVSKLSGAFVDVSKYPASANYSKFHKEIQWLHQVGLANGWNTKAGAEYRPTANIKRDAIAAFLYRAEFNLDS